MTNTKTSWADKSGKPPGYLVHLGEVHASGSRISLLNYNKEILEERTLQSIDEIAPYKAMDTVTWVTVEGLSNVEVIEAIGKLFDVHALVLEDILNTHQRPKFEEYEDYLFIVVKGLLTPEDAFDVNYEQISILVFNNFVFTFKEKIDDTFTPVIKRIMTSKGRFRGFGADYLTYAVLDLVVDRNFLVIDALAEAVDLIEEEVLTNPTVVTLKSIQSIKRELINIRRYVSPLRELLAALLRSESGLIQQSTHIYYRDVLDHVLRVSESLDS